ncbi:MAG: carbohydrate ABC transporter permease [Thermoprotei archaeon]|nr:MAG: carbohydrate ABC transporter permease [Thermoprotei archaeon]
MTIRYFLKKIIIKTSFGWIIALLWIVPIIGLLMAAIRPYREIVGGWWNLEPLTITLENFIKAWHGVQAQIPLYQALINGFMIAIPSTAIPLISGAMAAYVFSRFSTKIKNMLFLTIVFLQSVPHQLVLIPLFMLYSRTGLLSTYYGVWLVHSAFALPWIILFFRNFFATLPKEFEEAARIDGLTDTQIFFKIILPVSAPAIGSVVALQFLWTWNDLLFALTFIKNPDLLPPTVVIATMRSRYQPDWSLLSAAAMLSISVPLAIYALLQKYYVRGLVGGVIKG